MKFGIEDYFVVVLVAFTTRDVLKLVCLKLCLALNSVVLVANVVWCAGNLPNIDATHDVSVVFEEEMGTRVSDLNVAFQRIFVNVEDVAEYFAGFSNFDYSAIFLVKIAFEQHHFVVIAEAVLIIYLFYDTQALLLYSQNSIMSTVVLRWNHSVIVVDEHFFKQ